MQCRLVKRALDAFFAATCCFSVLLCSNCACRSKCVVTCRFSIVLRPFAKRSHVWFSFGFRLVHARFLFVLCFTLIELDVVSHAEVSRSDEDVLKVSLLGSNTSLDTYACAVKIQADRYH